MPAYVKAKPAQLRAAAKTVQKTMHDVTDVQGTLRRRLVSLLTSDNADKVTAAMAHSAAAQHGRLDALVSVMRRSIGATATLDAAITLAQSSRAKVGAATVGRALPAPMLVYPTGVTHSDPTLSQLADFDDTDATTAKPFTPATYDQTFPPLLGYRIPPPPVSWGTPGSPIPPLLNPPTFTPPSLTPQGDTPPLLPLGATVAQKEAHWNEWAGAAATAMKQQLEKISGTVDRADRAASSTFDELASEVKKLQTGPAGWAGVLLPQDPTLQHVARTGDVPKPPTTPTPPAGGTQQSGQGPAPATPPPGQPGHGQPPPHETLHQPPQAVLQQPPNEGITTVVGLAALVARWKRLGHDEDAEAVLEDVEKGDLDGAKALAKLAELKDGFLLHAGPPDGIAAVLGDLDTATTVTIVRLPADATPEQVLAALDAHRPVKPGEAFVIWAVPKPKYSATGIQPVHEHHPGDGSPATPTQLVNTLTRDHPGVVIKHEPGPGPTPTPPIPRDPPIRYPVPGPQHGGHGGQVPPVVTDGGPVQAGPVHVVGPGHETIGTATISTEPWHHGPHTGSGHDGGWHVEETLHAETLHAQPLQADPTHVEVLEPPVHGIDGLPVR